MVTAADPSTTSLRRPIGQVWLGIDVGTQGVRAIAVDDAGDVRGTGTAALGKDSRVGVRHEQDPKDWWTALCEATRALICSLDGTPIAGLAIDSTSGTLAVQAVDGSARGPALMYDDRRAEAQAARVQELGAELWGSLGYRMQPSWALPRLAWLAEHDRVGPADYVVHQGDYLARLLVGERVATDTNSALKTGYDLLSERWPVDLLDQLGIPAGTLPNVVTPGAPLGTVCADAAEQTGIPAGTPLSAGTTDGCAAQISTGALSPGQWTTALGTTLVVKGATEQLLVDPDGSVYCHRNPDGGWLPGGASSSGAGVVAQLLPGRDLDALSERLPSFPVRGFGYPLLGMGGERFPFNSSNAVQVLPGADDDAELLATIMQSVAFVERLAYQVLDGLGADTSGTVAFSGGATANGRWNQLRCDVLGRVVELPRSSQAALGAAVLAAAEPGRVAQAARRMVQIEQRLTPTQDTSLRAGLDEAYAEFVAELVERGWVDPTRLGRPASIEASGDGPT